MGYSPWGYKESDTTEQLNFTWKFVGTMSLLFSTLPKLVIAFLPWSKHLLISWLQLPSAVTLEPTPQIKSDTVSTVSPSISHEVMRPDAVILVF